MTIQGETSTNIEAFKLKDTDVQEARRNFSGYQVNQYYNLADMQDGDYAGTTDTDTATDTPAGGYSKINTKKGKSIL
jgi:hypothetical protein